jgi:hypothetical protein
MRLCPLSSNVFSGGLRRSSCTDSRIRISLSCRCDPSLPGVEGALPQRGRPQADSRYPERRFEISSHSLQFQKLYLLYNLYNMSMLATKRLAVTKPVWADLSGLKRPGETFSQLLAGMIEREKKARLIEHLKQIADEGDFVELPH